MPKIKISAIVNTRNEEENIEDCLKTLRFADEIIVVDMESEDKTVKLALKHTKNVFNHKNVGYVEPARNFAIKKATGSWILIVDADERIPRSLAVKLIKLTKDKEVDFVRIPRQNLIFGRWIKYSRWWPDFNIRFFKKGVVEWQDQIHSIPITTGTGINLDPTKELSITHHHYTSIDQYINRSVRYSKTQSKELIQEGYQLSPKDMFFKPIGEFLSRFFAGEGYKDGLHGFVLSLLQAFSTLLVYLYVWQEQGFKPVHHSTLIQKWPGWFKEKGKEIAYWIYTVKIHTAVKKQNRFLLRLKRKFLS
jgi:glycosyltransferase involved in cell wall biosynthesis